MNELIIMLILCQLFFIVSTLYALAGVIYYKLIRKSKKSTIEIINEL